MVVVAAPKTGTWEVKYESQIKELAIVLREPTR